MITFTKKIQEDFYSDYQGCIITKFSFVSDTEISNDLLLETFILSESFTFDSLSKVKRDNPNQGYLRQAFDNDLIKINDFRHLDKKGIISYLNEYLSEWEYDDRQYFEEILENYFKVLSNVSTDYFYLISKDWFEKGDPKVREAERWGYVYYFLIIWIDKVDNTLTISEWFYD